MQPERFLTFSLREPRVLRILSASLDAVEPGALVTQQLRREALPPHRRLVLLGLGKAAVAMTAAAEAAIGPAALGLIVTKHLLKDGVTESGRRGTVSAVRPRTSLRIMESGHPVPDARSLAAGESVLKLVRGLHADDLLVCLISGGASALVALPKDPLTMSDLQDLTAVLLGSGATIQEVNVLRRQMDLLKGGGLAAATRAHILSLILSDVIGDHLEAIGSGPTVPGPTRSEEAFGILRRYDIEPSENVRRALEAPPVAGRKSTFENVQNVIIGNNALAAQAAVDEAAAQGLSARLISTAVQGEARVVGGQMARALREAVRMERRPFCLVAGGETTVTLEGEGKGGRNQELGLAAVDAIAGEHHVLLVSMATDGEDGPTDAAGAVVTGESRDRALALGMDAQDYLVRNDSYSFFAPLGDLLKPGATGTNVNDLTLLVGL